MDVFGKGRLEDDFPKKRRNQYVVLDRRVYASDSTAVDSYRCAKVWRVPSETVPIYALRFSGISTRGLTQVRTTVDKKLQIQRKSAFFICFKTDWDKKVRGMIKMEKK